MSKKVLAGVSLSLAVVFFFWLMFLNHTEPSELGVARNVVTGHTWAQTKGGWHLTAPWTFVATIDLRPTKVSVDSAGRGYSAKLVEFVPEYWEDFVKTEGFRYWWWSNRISFNLGYDEEHRGIRDIFRGYAYGQKQYPFLRVLADFSE